MEKDRLGFTGPLIEDVIKLNEQQQESEKNANKLYFDGDDDHSTTHDLGGRTRSGTPISDWGHTPRATESPAAMEVDKVKGEEESELILASSSFPAGTPGQRGSVATPGPSGSLNVVNETQISPGTRHLSMARKVPRPASPEPPAAQETGPARVLAPPSDTSQSQSQTTRKTRLGGHVVETTAQLPWITLEEVTRIMKKTAELRLHNII